MKTFTFPVILLSLVAGVFAQPYSAWSKYRDITINTTGIGANVPGAVANFPVLVRLTSGSAATGSDVLSEALTGGADVRFADSTGVTALSYEIERWTASAAEIWVNVPSVTGNAITKIRMYWSRSGQTNASNGGAVFTTTNAFKGVWHLSEASGNVNDATVNATTGTNTGTTSNAAAAVGAGRDFNGTSNYIDLAASAALNFTGTGGTLSAWIRWTSSSGFRDILNHGSNPSEGQEVFLRINAGQYRAGTWDGSADHYAGSSGSTTADNGVWMHLVGVDDGANGWILYRNGVVRASTATGSYQGMLATSDSWHFGAQTISGTTFSRFFQGGMDEIRISSGARSADWIKLEYETQKPGATCVTLGTSISPPPSNLSYAPNPAVYTVGYAIPANSPTVLGGVTLYGVSPALPAGLALDVGTGVISGTPTAAAALAGYLVTATNANGSDTETVRITVNASLVAPTNLSYSRPTAIYGIGSAIAPNNPTVTGTVTNYSVSPGLPPGLVISATTGVISGTPTLTAGAANYTVTASNSAGSTLATVNIAVLAAPSSLSYSRPTATYFTSGAIAPNTPTVTGTVTGYSVTPTLPAGLNLNVTTGVISGTPTAVTAAANYTVTASNASGSTTATVNITVSGPPSDLNYLSNPVSYPINLAIPPNTPTVTGTVTRFSISPALSAGLILDTATGRISGTPTAVTAGSLAYTVSASNPGGSSTTTLYIEVYTPSAISPAFSNPFRLRISGNLFAALALPKGAIPFQVSILDVWGRSVWTRALNGSDEISWDGIADNGRVTAAGTYVVRLSLADAGKGSPLILERIINYSP